MTCSERVMRRGRWLQEKLTTCLFFAVVAPTMPKHGEKMKKLGKWAALLLAGVLATSALPADKQLRIGAGHQNSLYHRQLMELGRRGARRRAATPSTWSIPMAARAAKPTWCATLRIGQLQGGLLSVVGLREIDRPLPPCRTCR